MRKKSATQINKAKCIRLGYGEWRALATTWVFRSDTNNACLDELGVPGIGERGRGILNPTTIRQIL